MANQTEPTKPQRHHDKRATFCTCKHRLKSKVVVLTGGTSGIGYEVALASAVDDARVIFGARNEEIGIKTQEKIRKISGNNNVWYLPLDLTVLSSCVDFADQVLDLEPNISFLILNAAIYSHPTQNTTDTFEVTWQTNYLSSVVIVEQLKDNIGVGLDGNSGIIFLSSESALNEITDGDVSQYLDNSNKIAAKNDRKHKLRQYNLSKYALWVYNCFLAHSKPLEAPYSVVSVDPGKLDNHFYEKKGIISSVLNRLKNSTALRSPLEGAQTVLHCLNVPDLPNGCLMKDCQSVLQHSADCMNFSPAFVARTHATICSFIPEQT